MHVSTLSCNESAFIVNAHLETTANVLVADEISDTCAVLDQL